MIHSLPSSPLPHNSAAGPAGKKQEESSLTGSSPLKEQKNDTAVKDWTVLYCAETKANLDDSFTQKIPKLENFHFNDKLNVVAQLRDGETDRYSRYRISKEGKSVKYDASFGEDAGKANTSRSEALNDFISWGIREFPAKNYMVISSSPPAQGDNAAESVFYSGLTANREIENILSASAYEVREMPGFGALSLSSYTDEKYNGNQANSIAQAVHRMAGSVLPDKIKTDPQYKSLNSFFRKNGSGKLFEDYAQSIKNEKILSREMTKKTGLTASEMIAVRHYTARGFSPVNRALRDCNEESLAFLKPVIDPLVEGLEKLPSYRGTVYRTTSMFGSFLDSHKTGKEVTYRSFLSTSKYENWNEKSSFEGNVVMTIDCADRGKDISWLAEYPYEDEVLFPPETTFVVLSCQKKKGKHYIHLREKLPSEMKTT